MHPTIQTFKDVVAKGNEADLLPIFAEDIRFLPPTYWKTWTGREAVAAVLGHVGRIFTEFDYRRIMGSGTDWALEFQCKIGALDAVGVDLVTLNDQGLVQEFEVVMRPYKSVGVLRDAMNQAVMQDARFLKFKDNLS